MIEDRSANRNSDEHDRACREAQNAEARLLKLPAELRNLIHALCLPHAKTVFIYDRRPRVKHDIALLGVCRAIRCPAARYFYGNNHLQFGLTSWTNEQQKAEEVMAGLPSDIIASLRSVEFIARVTCNVSHHWIPHRLRVTIDRCKARFSYDVTFVSQLSDQKLAKIDCEWAQKVYRAAFGVLKSMNLANSEEPLQKEDLLSIMIALKGTKD